MTSYALLPVFAFVLNLIVWSYVFGQRKKDPVNHAFLLFSASAGGWLATHLLLYVPAIRGFEPLLFAVQSVFWIPLGVLFLNFAYALIGRKRDAFFKAALIITIVCNIVYFKTDNFIEGYRYFDWGIIQLYRKVPHTVVSSIAGFFAASGLFLIARQRRRPRDADEKKTLDLILVGGAVTLLATLSANVFLPLVVQVHDYPRYGSSAVVIFIVIVFFAVNKYRFLSISVESVANELFDDVNDGVLLVGTTGRIERENQAIRTMLRASTVGKPVRELFAGIDLTSDFVNRLIEIDTANGRRSLSVSASTSHRRGRKIGKFVIVRDVTEQKKAEEVLRRSRDELEKEVEKRTAELRHAQRMEAIGTFTGAIAHDFNNLLTAILGFTHAARNELPASSTARTDLSEVILAGRRAREIIRQLMTFSRQNDEIQYQTVSVQKIIGEAIELLRVSLPSTIHADYDIENCEGAVRCDPVQIIQVIMNLSTNAFHALKHTPNAKLRLVLENVLVDAEFARRTPPLRAAPHVRINVTDNGCGMDAETIEKIFDPFFTTKPTGEGTGLGLSTSLGIVRNHQGAIVVKSERSKGTTFSVYLPQYDAAAEEIVDEEERIQGGDERILVVDDEDQVGRLMVRLLSPLGYRITVKSNGRDALKAVQENPEGFDLVLTDYTMPELTGTELAKNLLEIRPGLPIILTSGYGKELTPQDVLSIGIKALLKKPVPVRELLSAIRDVLDVR